MANKLGLSNVKKELKLGKSFGKGENFHTFRYDFMPASVDTSKRATVDIGDGHQVTVTVPHIEGSGTANTVFKGSKKPYQKECVLIIDHTTGEITLEKLSYNVQLKKTRAEGSSKIRSSTPVEGNYVSKKSPPSHKLSPHQKPNSTFGRSSPNQKCSPLPKSPIGNHPSPNGNSNSSMPCLNALSSYKPPAIPEVPSHSLSCEEPAAAHAPEVGVLSSSSSSESSSSGESSDSESSDHEEMSMNQKSHKHDLSNGAAESHHKKERSSAYSSSNTLSMPSANSMPSKSMPSGISMPSMSSSNSLPSMPKFNLLSEDLKLSESDSDQSE
ncbi:ELL-associated factor 2 [Parasteatoda tepidariorum]|uniref:Ell-associated factor Eaf n=1 Tax=Parasteatoda tepidariorum TaxID=114398 RepID=A0A2L2XYJ2_PARTP|nr:ELL-associated factor 2 [Parasteatoda tepidariorum]